MTMSQYIKRYRKQGKSDAWIRSWQRKWHEVGRRLKQNKAVAGVDT